MRLLGVDDLVGGREADRDRVELPDDEQRRSAANGRGALLGVALSPTLGRRQPRGVYSQELKVLGRGAMEVVDDELRLFNGHLSNDERHGDMIPPTSRSGPAWRWEHFAPADLFPRSPESLKSGATERL